MEGKAVKEIQAKMKTWTDAGIELAYNSGYVQGCQDRDEIYAEDMEGKWIPVSERLPEDHDWYLIVVKEKSTGYQYIPRVASHIHDNDWCLIDTEDADKDWLDDLECVAWMPLPEPYKESEEGGSDDIQ